MGAFGFVYALAFMIWLATARHSAWAFIVSVVVISAWLVLYRRHRDSHL